MHKKPQVDLTAPDAQEQLHDAMAQVHAGHSAVMRNGVSASAMRLLEKAFGADNDVFEIAPNADPMTLALRAAKRDGQLSVLRYIKRLQRVQQ